jgi:hypothetical protein
MSESKVFRYEDVIAVHAKEVGDYTQYFFTAARVKDANGRLIYVASGGYGYAPSVGGFFPRQSLVEFDEFVLQWHAEEFNFSNQLFERPFFNYMLGKQTAPNMRKWELAVAFVIAWLIQQSDGIGDLITDDETMQIIGYFYHNQHRNGAQVLTHKLGALDPESV